MKTIREEWADFEQMVVPKEATQLQRKEMQKSFYAGFSSALYILTKEVTMLSDDDAEEALSKLIRESEAFFKDLAKDW